MNFKALCVNSSSVSEYFIRGITEMMNGDVGAKCLIRGIVKMKNGDVRVEYSVRRIIKHHY